MKRVCIHQPDFAPYLGFFDRLLDADAFIVLDDAQFLRRGWHHRDRIKTRQGPAWLTLSVEKAPREAPINSIRLSPERAAWMEGNLNLLTEHYKSAPCFEAEFPAIEALYRSGAERLIDFNLAVLEHLYDRLDLRVNSVPASRLGVGGARTRRLVDLVRAVEGTHYVTGTGALDYLEPALFADAGIVLEIQALRHPVYPQLHGPFESHLSCFDALLNCGDRARDVVRSCRG